MSRRKQRPRPLYSDKYGTLHYTTLHYITLHMYMHEQWSQRQCKAGPLHLKTALFAKKELPQVAFDPMTYCVLGTCSTNYMYNVPVYVYMYTCAHVHMSHAYICAYMYVHVCQFTVYVRRTCMICFGSYACTCTCTCSSSHIPTYTVNMHWLSVPSVCVSVECMCVTFHNTCTFYFPKT